MNQIPPITAAVFNLCINWRDQAVFGITPDNINYQHKAPVPKNATIQLK